MLAGVFGDVLWQLRLELVFLRGFERIDFTFTMVQVTLPVFVFLLDHLLIPYCLARLVGLLFLESYMLRSLIMRYSFAVYLIVRLLFRSYGFIKAKLIKLHNDIHDSRYLLGTELKNR
jgi:hypothetical protein